MDRCPRSQALGQASRHPQRYQKTGLFLERSASATAGHCRPCGAAALGLGAHAVPKRQLRGVQAGGARRVAAIVPAGVPMMRELLVALARGYQLLVGSWMPASCRFHPSCSGYAIEALRRHGAAMGSYLAVTRIV